jgi:YebC/PmpR family DNA-binding regulatory protein
MAGHSKWANIKHRKAAADAKRGHVFTKLAKEIMVSARLGGSDLSINPRLRTAVTKARETNMPKDNIEKAIKKGAGELEGINYEEIVYEGYGPKGVALIIEVVTDKKSRTIPELKSILSKAGGGLGETGSVSFLFDYWGLIAVEGKEISEDELLDIVLESGAEDYEKEEDNIYIVKTQNDKFHNVLNTITPLLEAKNCTIVNSELRYIPKSTIELEPEDLEKVRKLMDILDEHDDVQNVYSNHNDPDETESVE